MTQRGLVQDEHIDAVQSFVGWTGNPESEPRGQRTRRPVASQ
jgi:hypothetical protein